MVTRSASTNQRQNRAKPAKKAKPTNPTEDVEIFHLSTDEQSEEGVLGKSNLCQKEHFIDFENILRTEGHLNTLHNPINRNDSRPILLNNEPIMRCGGDDLGAHASLSICQKYGLISTQLCLYY